MNLFRLVVLAHNPGRRLPNLAGGTLRQRGYRRIEFFDSGISALDAFLDARESMLNVPRILLVCQISRDLFVGNVSAKPCAVPGEERHNNKERRQNDQRQRRAATFWRNCDRSVSAVSVIVHAIELD